MNDLNKTVGRVIVALRSTAGLSAPQVARVLGWPPATLANFEVGRRPLTVERLAAIAAALNRHPAALLVEDTERADLINTILTDEATYQQIRYLLTALDEVKVENRKM